MKFKWYFLCLLAPLISWGQSAELANSYFRKGEYAKAIILYEPLFENNPIRQDYFKALLTCYQQIDQYDEAEALLQRQLADFPGQNYLLVEIGYNHQLQGEQQKAVEYYDRALSAIEFNPGYAFAIGRTFRQNHLLDYALRTYQRAKELNPNLNTEISEAQIYGEMGEIDHMFSLYLDLVEKNENYYSTAQRFIGSFLSEDSSDPNNILLRKQLLKRAQASPQDSWNRLLSWLFMQQGDFDKALVQERSLFNRNPVSVSRIEEIGKFAYESEDYEVARQAFTFVLENSAATLVDTDQLIGAHIYLLKIDIELIETDQDREDLDLRFNQLIEEFGLSESTLDLQMAYAEFLTFSNDDPKKAIEVLKRGLEQTNAPQERGKLQMALADIQVFSGQFNQALIVYSKLQYDFKNSPLAQEARFKVARTSYFKGDFEWAQNQLNVLKSSTSQLIANDALRLNLLITGNMEKDSVNTGLELYAEAELYEYQRKYDLALSRLGVILDQHKGRQIEDDALYKMGVIQKETGNFSEAEMSLQRLLAEHPQSLLTDDGVFLLGQIYYKHMEEPERAQKMFERILFEFPSSIYLVEARKYYRTLRGDEL